MKRIVEDGTGQILYIEPSKVSALTVSKGYTEIHTESHELILVYMPIDQLAEQLGFVERAPDPVAAEPPKDQICKCPTCGSRMRVADKNILITLGEAQDCMARCALCMTPLSHFTEVQ